MECAIYALYDIKQRNNYLSIIEQNVLIYLKYFVKNKCETIYEYPNISLLIDLTNAFLLALQNVRFFH